MFKGFKGLIGFKVRILAGFWTVLLLVARVQAVLLVLGTRMTGLGFGGSFLRRKRVYLMLVRFFGNVRKRLGLEGYNRLLSVPRLICCWLCTGGGK